jgi:hypothetical protein
LVKLVNSLAKNWYNQERIPVTMYPPLRWYLSLFLYLRNVDVDVSKGSVTGAPASVLDSIFIIGVKGFN